MPRILEFLYDETYLITKGEESIVIDEDELKEIIHTAKQILKPIVFQEAVYGRQIDDVDKYYEDKEIMFIGNGGC